MIWGVLQFPGSCDERDALRACERAGGEARLVWHEERDLGDVDAVVVPGGFSYGDYLRAGAIARFSPAMEAVAEFAAAGGPVLGICNGFQVLCEAGLLPGALLVNEGMRFVCRQVELVGARSPTSASERLSIPVKHGEGRYWAPEEALDELEAGGQVAFRYAPGQNPNGSARDIAGVRNEAGNVLGLMPHPEHAVDEMTGSTDGLRVFEPSRVAARRVGVTLPPQRPPPRARPDRRRVRADRREARARAERGRAGDVQPAVVRALRLQALAQAAAAAAHRGRAGGDGAGRERRRGRRRRRLRRRLQGRVAQPPERGRTVPGGGDRRRRDPARRLRARRAADRDPRLAALRRARLASARATCSTARCAGSATTATRSACRRSAARSTSRRPTSTTAWSTRCASAWRAPRRWSGRRRPGSATRSS